MRARPLVAVVLVGTVLAAAAAARQPPSVLRLLEQYSRGQFDAVVEVLTADGVDYGAILRDLRRDAPGWIAGGGPAVRARRELAAATFALEAARAGQWVEWKLTQKQPQMCPPGSSNPEDCHQPLNIVYWRAPPLLIEWGCALFRADVKPRPIERWWQLAALAVAQRAEDPQFLVGDTKIGLGVNAGEIGNTQDEIKHLEHVRPRFPTEMRFVLAEGIARDRDWQDDATQAYMALAKDPDVGGEAMMRFGAMHLRARRIPPALESLTRAGTLTRDPYVVFLAEYFKAKAFEAERLEGRAEAAYRGAVAAVPHAQSATIALAALIFPDGARAEAHGLVRDLLQANPPPVDPWRAFAHADDRFWPQLIGRLRAEILR